MDDEDVLAGKKLGMWFKASSFKLTAFALPLARQYGTGMARGHHPGRRKQKEHEKKTKEGRGERIRDRPKVTKEAMLGKGKRPGTPSVEVRGAQRSMDA